MDYNGFIQVLSVSLIFPMLFFNLHYPRSNSILNDDFVRVMGNTTKEDAKKKEILDFALKTWLLQVVLPTTVILIPNALLFCELLSTSIISVVDIDYYRTFYFFLAIFLIAFEIYVIAINIVLIIKRYKV